MRDTAAGQQKSCRSRDKASSLFMEPPRYSFISSSLFRSLQNINNSSLTGSQKKSCENSRIFGGKKGKNMLTVSWLKYFLKMSHNLDVNLSLSLHLIIISSGQPFNSYNVNHAAVTDEIHTCIQFCAWKRRRKCRPFATPIFLREIQLFAVSLP